MTALNACMEKQEWLDNGGENLTMDDFNKHKQILAADILEPIIVKMSEPRKLVLPCLKGTQITPQKIVTVKIYLNFELLFFWNFY